jgi:CsoR family transcriptional regulator, copper-sensing transcriptional repressor
MTIVNKDELIKRLKRAEGQVAGIRRMVNEDQECVRVLLQIAAVQGALGKVGHILLGTHIETCVRQAFESGDEADGLAKTKELMQIFERYSGIGSA